MSPKRRIEKDEEEQEEALIPGKLETDDVDGVEGGVEEEEDDGGLPEGAAYFYGENADAI